MSKRRKALKAVNLEQQRQQLLEDTFEARRRLHESFGRVEPYVFGKIVNPAMMGGPEWPNWRQAHWMIHRTNSTMIISDGLSDACQHSYPENPTGFGFEVYIETKDAADLLNKTISDVIPSWLYQVVDAVSQSCAEYHELLLERLAEHTYLSQEVVLSPNLLPRQYQNPANHTAAVILGIPSPDIPAWFEAPGGRVRLMSVKLISQADLQRMLARPGAGRTELAEQFIKDGSCHFSSIAS
eukprot:GILK01012208.1.p1 GENE.GILK01012208.1~~GILK01012208.1.p1  ORF type:complete len:267 (-),score=26.64 GILK01012208.1:494-1213(-)